MTARNLFWIGFATVLLTAFGCSDSGNSGSSSPTFACTDGGAAPADGVTLACGGATGGTTQQVNVTMAGPAASTTTLKGFSFDVTYDSTKLTFVPDATPVSPLMPDALVAVSLYNGLPGRVVVAIQQPGTLSDVAVDGTQHVVLTLSFQRVSGATFGPSQLSLENAEATGASAAVTFASVLALAYQ